MFGFSYFEGNYMCTKFGVGGKRGGIAVGANHMD